MKAERNYDVVVALNYYSPYVSGVTEAARVIAEGLAAGGLRVAVVAGRHEAGLPSRENLNGVEVIRTAVIARFGKGIISPGFVPTIVKLARRARLLLLNAPMLEAGPIAAAVRRTPIITIYQCDVTLPPGLLNRVQETVLDASHRLAVRRSQSVVVSSEDYAQSSRLWPSFRRRPMLVIPPPAVLRPAGKPSYRSSEGIHVGFLGRIVEEKGLEYLVEGFRALDDPHARLLIGGDYKNIAGGSVIDKVRSAIGGDPRITMLGFLPNESIADFYSSIDIFALPSVNALEAFGLVQVEAMMAGVPSLASDLPGVRMPVRNTGFGVIVLPKDPAAITAAIIELRDNTLDREAGAAATRDRYLASTVIDRYRELFAHLPAPR
jgi:glycosyltransferase involved in cell wall biosynthesis